MSGLLRLFFRFLYTSICILLITFLMSITWLAGARRATRAIMQVSFRISATVWGIRITVRGLPAQQRPLLIVSNHFSYLDLFVLGGVLPVAFTPKSEIRSWPVIGFMCRAAGCLFIDRRAARTLENKQNLEKALAEGDIISLFPEGTTSDGTGLLPFKSSFFGLAKQTGMPVQPVSICYTRLNGKPVTPEDLPTIGWYGDSLFFPHVAHYLQQESLEAVILFHPPVPPEQFASRKELAVYCRDVIERGMEQCSRKA